MRKDLLATSLVALVVVSSSDRLKESISQSLYTMMSNMGSAHASVYNPELYANAQNLQRLVSNVNTNFAANQKKWKIDQMQSVYWDPVVIQPSTPVFNATPQQSPISKQLVQQLLVQLSKNPQQGVQQQPQQTLQQSQQVIAQPRDTGDVMDLLRQAQKLWNSNRAVQPLQQQRSIPQRQQTKQRKQIQRPQRSNANNIMQYLNQAKSQLQKKSHLNVGNEMSDARVNNYRLQQEALNEFGIVKSGLRDPNITNGSIYLWTVWQRSLPLTTDVYHVKKWKLWRMTVNRDASIDYRDKTWKEYHFEEWNQTNNWPAYEFAKFLVVWDLWINVGQNERYKKKKYPGKTSKYARSDRNSKKSNGKIAQITRAKKSKRYKKKVPRVPDRVTSSYKSKKTIYDRSVSGKKFVSTIVDWNTRRREWYRSNTKASSLVEWIEDLKKQAKGKLPWEDKSSEELAGNRQVKQWDRVISEDWVLKLHRAWKTITLYKRHKRYNRKR